MSSFDDAFNRIESEAKSYAEERQSKDERYLAIACKLVPEISGSLVSFARTLTTRGVAPTRVMLTEKSGLFKPAKYSPAGFPIYTWWWRLRPGFPQSLATVTADGRLWAWSGNSVPEGEVFEGYIDIKADTLLNPYPSFVFLGCTIGDDGMLRNSDSDGARAATFQELLARQAQKLIESAQA